MKTTPTSPKKSAAPRAAKKPAPAKKAARKPAAKKTPAKKTLRAKPAGAPLRALVEKVRGLLAGKKGENIVVMNVAKVSDVTDYMILCSGLNAPHLRALADEVAKQLRLETPPVAAHRHAGSAESEWLVLDYFDFVVHLFTPSMRAYYALEQLWKDAPVVS
jgi:ribosome-associated protein